MLYGQPPYWEAPPCSSYSSSSQHSSSEKGAGPYFSSSSPGPFFPCASRMCGPRPLVCLTELGNMEINKASIRQESKARIGGWEECCLRLCPNPEMPEKAPGATSSLEVGCFPQPPLACADQEWSKAGSHAIPTCSSSGCPGPSSLCHPHT